MACSSSSLEQHEWQSEPAPPACSRFHRRRGVSMGHSQDLDYSCEHDIYKQGLILESRSGELIHYGRTGRSSGND